MKLPSARLRPSLRIWLPLLSFWLLFGSRAVQAQPPVTFADPQMQLAVEQKLQAQGVSTVAPTTAQMLLLTNLPAANFNIQDTAGLQYASNLTALFLNGNPITNYSGIFNLTLLTNLDIGLDNGANPVTNIDFLSNFTRIQSISLYGDGGVSNFAPFLQMTNLMQLDVDGTSPTNVNLIVVLTNLNSLAINNLNPPLTNMSFLSGMWRLQHLEIAGNLIPDMSPLAGKTNLVFLDLDANLFTNLSVIANFTNLTTLEVGVNIIANLSPLAGLANLTTLDASVNAIADVTSLAGLTALQSLDLDVNSITDISALAGLTNLTSLSLAGDVIPDLSPLEKLFNLQTLSLYGEQASNLSAVAGLTNLSTFFLGANSITSLAPLAGLFNLQTLYIPFNSAPLDLTPLAGLTNLSDFSAQQDSVTNLAPLAGLVQLSTLNLGQNGIYSLAALAGLVNLNNLDVSGNQLANISPLTNLLSLQMADVSGNTLYLADGAPASNIVNTLMNLGVNITYLPQNPAPVITGQPSDLSLASGDTAVFTVAATSTDSSGISYLWYFNGYPMSDTPDGRITGTLTDTLTITNVGGADIGSYFAVVTDDTGTIYGDVAPLSVDGAAIFGAARLGAGIFQFSISSPPGQTFQVQASTDLINWNPLNTVVNTTGVLLFTDTSAAAVPWQFYRLRQQ